MDGDDDDDDDDDDDADDDDDDDDDDNDGDDDDDINVQCIGPCQLERPTIVLVLGIDRKQGLICFPLCSGLLSFPTELYM